jgi:crotonobetainyl-CoA:carnitine CoA-transferase CaiB-like acyl-CoA transferase
VAWLDGLRVLDCTDERGLLAGRLLADLGADVVAVEPPGGSPARTVPPLAADGGSLLWDAYGANRRSVTCDLTTGAGRDTFTALARTADFLIESAGAGELDRLGLGWSDLASVNPRLVYVSITAFGTTGPKASWPATDLTLWAAGGPLAYNLDEDGRPLRLSVPQTWLHASADAAGAALVAHHARRRTGRGQHVVVSAQASLGLATLAAVLTAVTGDHEPSWIPKPGELRVDESGSGSRTRRSKWPVRDGWVELHLGMGPAVGEFTNRLFAWMLDEGTGCDPDIAAWDWTGLSRRIRAGEVRAADMERARHLVASFLGGRTKAEVTDAALHRKLLAVGIADVADLAASPHAAARSSLVTLGGDGRPVRTVPGPVARCSEPAFAFRRGAPHPGEHDGEVPAEWSTAPQPAPPAPTGDGCVPFAGLKVADLSWVVAGPVVGRALADFGATVVRVESSAKIDTARHMGPFYGGHHDIESSALYISTNAGKLGLAVDLATAEGRAVVGDLAAWADVLLESYTPGRMESWGLGYDALATRNPGLVMLSSSLMGQTGPLSRLAGYGNVGAAMSGLQHVAGWSARPPLGPFGPYTDFVAPRLALVALLAALEERARTGRGCYLDVSQVECGAWFLAPQIAAYFHDGSVQGRCGNRDAVCVPHGVWPTRPDGSGGADHVAIAVRNDDDWCRLADVVGGPKLASDARYATAEGRRSHETRLEELIGAWAEGRTAAAAEEACVTAGVPAHRAAKSADYVADPQLAHLGHLVHLPHPQHGEVVVEAPRFALHATPGRVTRPAPAIGQDTREVLVDLLGYRPEVVDALTDRGVLR